MELPEIAILIGLYLAVGLFWYALILNYFKADHDLWVCITCLTLWPMVVIGIIVCHLIDVFGAWIKKRKEKKK